MNKLKLHDEFCNDDINHFTNYDYFLQLVDNGQFSALKEFISEIDTKGLLNLIRYNDFKEIVMTYLETEIINRCDSVKKFDTCFKCQSNEYLEGGKLWGFQKA